MRMGCKFLILLVVLALGPFALPEDKTEPPVSGGPANEKAQKTFKNAMGAIREHDLESALGGFKKADKQDDGHCRACQEKMLKYGRELGDWKTAELGAEEMLSGAKDKRETAILHQQLAVLYMSEALERNKDECLTRAHEELTAALAAYANFPAAVFLDGQALARLQKDDAAKARFEQFIKMEPADSVTRQRALRFANRPELARARMAPAFAVTTTDGKRLSMDDLQGKVVLIDFWATWCAPCREALPRIRDIARKFQGQPLVVLSVSVDDDQEKWKDFISKNEMTWPQYCDNGFTGSVAKMFSVREIPHTFTIDAEGVLQEEHVGDASIEGKLKKLIAKARTLQAAENTAK